MDQKKQYEDWVTKEIDEWNGGIYNLIQKEDGFEVENKEIKLYWDTMCFEVLHSFFTDCSYFYPYIYEDQGIITYFVDFMLGEIEFRYTFSAQVKIIDADILYKLQDDTHYHSFVYEDVYLLYKKQVLQVEEKYNVLMDYMMDMPHVRLRFAVGALQYREDCIQYEKIFSKIKSTKEDELYESEKAF